MGKKVDGLTDEDKADIAYDSFVFYFNRSQELLAKFYRALSCKMEYLAEWHFRRGLALYHRCVKERERFLKYADRIQKRKDGQ